MVTIIYALDKSDLEVRKKVTSGIFLEHMCVLMDLSLHTTYMQLQTYPYHNNHMNLEKKGTQCLTAGCIDISVDAMTNDVGK